MKYHIYIDGKRQDCTEGFISAEDLISIGILQYPIGEFIGSKKVVDELNRLIYSELDDLFFRYFYDGDSKRLKKLIDEHAVHEYEWLTDKKVIEQKFVNGQLKVRVEREYFNPVEVQLSGNMIKSTLYTRYEPNTAQYKEFDRSERLIRKKDWKDGKFVKSHEKEFLGNGNYIETETFADGRFSKIEFDQVGNLIKAYHDDFAEELDESLTIHSSLDDKTERDCTEDFLAFDDMVHVGILNYPIGEMAFPEFKGDFYIVDETGKTVYFEKSNGKICVRNTYQDDNLVREEGPNWYNTYEYGVDGNPNKKRESEFESGQLVKEKVVEQWPNGHSKKIETLAILHGRRFENLSEFDPKGRTLLKKWWKNGILTAENRCEYDSCELRKKVETYFERNLIHTKTYNEYGELENDETVPIDPTKLMIESLNQERYHIDTEDGPIDVTEEFLGVESLIDIGIVQYPIGTLAFPKKGHMLSIKDGMDRTVYYEGDLTSWPANWSRTWYNGLGKVVKIEDGLYTIEYEYMDGQLYKEIKTNKSSRISLAKTITEYWPNSGKTKRITELDIDGNASSYEYDEMGNEIEYSETSESKHVESDDHFFSGMSDEEVESLIDVGIIDPIEMVNADNEFKMLNVWPKHIVKILINHFDPFYREYGCMCKNIPMEDALKLVKSRDYNSCWYLSKNMSCSSEVLAAIYKSYKSDNMILPNIVLNPNLPIDILLKIANDPESGDSTLVNVCRNPKCPIETIKQLKDQVGLIRSFNKIVEILKERGQDI